MCPEEGETLQTWKGKEFHSIPTTSWMSLSFSATFLQRIPALCFPSGGGHLSSRTPKQDKAPRKRSWEATRKQTHNPIDRFPGLAMGGAQKQTDPYSVNVDSGYIRMFSTRLSPWIPHTKCPVWMPRSSAIVYEIQKHPPLEIRSRKTRKRAARSQQSPPNGDSVMVPTCTCHSAWTPF